MILSTSVFSVFIAGWSNQHSVDAFLVQEEPLLCPVNCRSRGTQ